MIVNGKKGETERDGGKRRERRGGKGGGKNGEG